MSPGSSALNASKADERCFLCNGELVEKKLKRFCSRCGQLCETCCDGGCPSTEM